jgi:phosphoglycerate dehydrogenase-like enzyme
VGVLDASTSPPKERYAVSNDNVTKLIQPGVFDDQLTEILRNGARALLAQAVEVEVTDFLGKRADVKTALSAAMTWCLRPRSTAGCGRGRTALGYRARRSSPNRGITVAEVTYCNSISVSEHVVMMILALARNYIPSYQWVVKGGWNIADCVTRSGHSSQHFR